jgi:hypothetical protein
MSANVSSFWGHLLAIAAVLAIATAGNALAGPPGGGGHLAAAGKWTDLFAYPKGGQSVEQQGRDRAECHDWAVSQTGFDPAQPSHEDPKDWAAKRDSYLRAEAACLEGRNYSVR